ncbi:MAG: phosphate signaling complex protein PhoU [Isosphaeraceae bacterium]|nr:phosphate signaling complex protein PhoU [Isosphaeraceae bacterium]
MPSSNQDPQGSPTTPTAVVRHALTEQDAVWRELLRLAQAVEVMLAASVSALCDGRIELVPDVRAQERAIDGWEVRVERECLRVLTLYEPVASDLRRVAVALKVNGNLERVGDLATHIAKRAGRLAREPGAPPVSESLAHLARQALQAFRDSIRALESVDSDLARSVNAADDAIDGLYRGVVDEYKQAIRRDPEQLDNWLRLINSARNLERVADHATNIAEAVIYLKEGQLVRHRGEA